MVLACVISAACDPVGWDYPLNRPRSQVISPDFPSHYDEDNGNGKTTPSIPPDTILYICGVRTPGEYDWQRDTGLGIARGEIVLFKNVVEEFSIPTGYNECASTDPDTHHLINGHLFTEFSSASSTFIKMDGETILTFDDREFLLGLVKKQDSIWTLGMHRSGKGFCLRRNGVIVFESMKGTVLGSFADSSYPGTGALYEDSEAVWFAYNVDEGGNRYSHIVKNGRDSTLLGTSYDDIRVIGGRLLGVRRTSDIGFYYYDGNATSLIGTTYNWEECILFNVEGKAFALGNVNKRNGTAAGKSFIAMNLDTKEITTYPPGDYHLYTDCGTAVVSPAYYDGYHYFSRSCMGWADGVLYVGLSPKSDTGKPLLRINGKDTELDMNGYITGVEVLLSPPN